MRLNILQSSTLEIVENTLIKKIYSICNKIKLATEEKDGNLTGRIKTDSTYQYYITLINEIYPQLEVQSDNYYIKFEDPNAEKVCAVFFGDGFGVTEVQMANADFSSNNKHSIEVNGQTFINETFDNVFKLCGATKFNEFMYCTGVTAIGEYKTKIGFENNKTLTEFTLPPSCTYLGSYIFATSPSHGAIGPIIHGIENVTWLDGYAFWGKGGENIELDFTKILGNYYSSNSGMMYNMRSVKGNIILPKYPTTAWDSTKNFDCIGQYCEATKVVHPETFVCKNHNFNRADYCNIIIFLNSSIRPFMYCDGWRNQNLAPAELTPDGQQHMYWPDSICPQTSDWVNTSSGTYEATVLGETVKLYYCTKPEPLSNYANISEANKEELISYGCTVTGSSLGNYIVKAPGES